MTFTTAFPFIFIAIFFITLLFALAPFGVIKWLWLGLDGVLWLIEFIWFLDYLHSPLYDYQSPNYNLLLMMASFGAFALGYPLTKLRAGKLILRMPRSNPMNIIGLIFVPIFLGGALFVLRPTLYRESDHSPVIDAQYFNSHGILFLFMLVMGLYFLSQVLQRTEFRQRGLVQNGTLWKWNGFVSHEWHEMSDKPAVIELILKIRPRKLLFKQIKLNVPQSNKQQIDDLLAKDR